MTRYSKDPLDRVCFALDVTSIGQARPILSQLKLAGVLPWVKFGHSLIYAPDGGPRELVKLAHEFGIMNRVILDPKFKDTPTTMMSAVLGVLKNGFPFYTVDIASGTPSLKALSEHKGVCGAIGFSVLTSLTDKHLCELGYADGEHRPEELLRVRIELGLQYKIKKHVCSPKELLMFRERGLFEECDFYTPGVVSEGKDPHGQVRRATPRVAMEADPRMIIIGREIYESNVPADQMRRVCEEVEATF